MKIQKFEDYVLLKTPWHELVLDIYLFFLFLYITYKLRNDPKTKRLKYIKFQPACDKRTPTIWTNVFMDQIIEQHQIRHFQCC
jgi:hypothetical protein